MRGRTALIAVGAIVAATVAIALSITGGPMSARRERYDAARYEELVKLARILRCESQRGSSQALPETLSVESLRTYCGGIERHTSDLTDNETGEQYGYERLNSRAFKICAKFYDPKILERRRYHLNVPGYFFDYETGCISGSVS